MKTGKRFLAAMLAALIILSLSPAVLADAGSVTVPSRDDEQTMKDAVHEYLKTSEVSDIPAPISDRVAAIFTQLTQTQKAHLVAGILPYENCLHNGTGAAGFIPGIPELGIPDLYVADGEMGVNLMRDATQMPAKVALAATFDHSAALAYGKVLGEEAEAAGIHVLLTPRVNIARDPLSGGNGGNFQTYGEDGFLNGQLGAQEVLGIQANGNVIAEMKQMYGSSTGAAQGAGHVFMNDQAKMEIYLSAFSSVVRNAAPGAAMTNYNSVNGVQTASDPFVNLTLLRGCWGFDGFLSNDWMQYDGEYSLKSGLDLRMPYGDAGSLLNEIAGGEGSTGILDQDKALDRAVMNLLNTYERFGFLTDPSAGELISADEMIAKMADPDLFSGEMIEAHADVAREIAEGAAVLLKNNDQALPLKSDETFAVFGANGAQLAGPTFKESAYGFLNRKIGPLEALEAALGRDIPYSVGVDLAGQVIPADVLFTLENGSEGGVLETLVLCNGQSNQTNTISNIDYFGSRAFSEDITAATWTTWLEAPETGLYKINLISMFPDGGDYAAAIADLSTETWDRFASLSYTLCSIKIDGTQLAGGQRLTMNGGAAPQSSMVCSPEGGNITGGFIYLEAGQRYELTVTDGAVYTLDGKAVRPLESKLTWVTPSMMDEDIHEAAQLAKTVDKAVVFIWQDASSHSINQSADAQLASYHLAGRQEELIRAIAAVNENTIVVMNNGDPFDMSSFKDLENVKALLEMWLPGQEGGTATANLLLGKANPSGKLPVTFPEALSETPVHDPDHPERWGPSSRETGYADFTEGVNMGYRWYDAEGVEPAYEFGFGLSYTTFAYSGLKVTEAPDGGYYVTFTLTNTGAADGAEVPQVYVSRPEDVPSGIQMSPKVLGAFDKVFLKAGHSKEITLHVEKERLCYWDSRPDETTIHGQVGYVVADGARTFYVGASSRDLRLEATVNVPAGAIKHEIGKNDPSALNAATARVEALAPQDYTEESWQTLLDAAAAADGITETTAQAQLNRMTATINLAIGQLAEDNQPRSYPGILAIMAIAAAVIVLAVWRKRTAPARNAASSQ